MTYLAAFRTKGLYSATGQGETIALSGSSQTPATYASGVVKVTNLSNDNWLWIRTDGQAATASGGSDPIAPRDFWVGHATGLRLIGTSGQSAHVLAVGV